MAKRGMRPEERARRIQALTEIVIQHPRLLTVEERVDELIGDTETMMKVNRKRAAETRGNEHPDHFWILPIVGPSGATKSKTIQSVRAKINNTAKKGEIPIDYVSIKETTKNTKALYHQIFEALGDTNNMLNLERTTSPAARVIEEAIRNTIEPRNTRILVLDEIHNLLIHAGRHTCKAMPQALKGILNNAVCSLVALGTEDALELFEHEELVGRVLEPVDLGKLDIRVPYERDYFFEFVNTYERRLVRDGVLDCKYGLASDVTNRAMIYEAADGVIGMVPRLMRVAIPIAFREGRGTLVNEDLQKAVAGWWRLQKKTKPNPYVAGAQAVTMGLARR
jgi:hypothetical protein